MRVKCFEQGSCVKFHISRSRSQIHVKKVLALHISQVQGWQVPAESNTLGAAGHRQLTSLPFLWGLAWAES